MQQLPPAPGHVAVFDSYVARRTETLILKEKVLSLSGDSFDIRLAGGQPVFRVQGRLMSLSGRKSVYDTGGRHLFDIRKRLCCSLLDTYVAEDPQGRVFLAVRSYCTCFGSKAKVELTPARGPRQTLAMRGDWMGASAEITCDGSGAVVAAIDRRMLNARELLCGQQTYALHVAPGVDMAVMVALCIAFDEGNND